MKHSIFAGFAMIALALGCGSKKSEDKSGSDPKAAAAKLEEFRAQMCKCADETDAAKAKACGEKVDAAQDTWEDGFQLAMEKGTVKLDEETETLMENTKNAFRDCRDKTGADH